MPCVAVVRRRTQCAVPVGPQAAHLGGALGARRYVDKSPGPTCSYVCVDSMCVNQVISPSVLTRLLTLLC